MDLRTLLRCPHCQKLNIRLPPGVSGTVVGRFMLLTDVQLRKFSIEKHWTQYNDSMHSPDSSASWVYEYETPALGDPPTSPKIISGLFDQLFALIPPENADFNHELRIQIADSKDKIIIETKDLPQTAHWYIDRWRATRNLTTLTKGVLAMFEGLVFPQLLDYATKEATHGVFPMGIMRRSDLNKTPIHPLMITQKIQL